MCRCLKFALKLCAIILISSGCNSIENYNNVHVKFSRAISEAAHYSDGQWLPYGNILLTSESLSWGMSRLYIGNPQTGEVAPLLMNGDYLSGGSAVVSPDGHYMAHDVTFTDLKIVRMTRPLSDTMSFPFQGSIAWSPTSDQIAVMSLSLNTITIRLIDLSRQDVKTILTWADPLIRRFGDIAWSPDGTTLVFTVGLSPNSNVRPQFDIFGLSLGVDRVIRLTDSPMISEESLSWLPDSKSIAFVSIPTESADTAAKISLIDLQTKCVSRFERPTNIERISLSYDSKYAVVISSSGDAYVLDMNDLRKNEKVSVSCPK